MSKSELPDSMSCELVQLPPRFARLAMAMFCGWMLIVLVLGTRMAYQSISTSLALLGSAKITTQPGASLAPGIPDPPVMFVAAALTIYSVVVFVILLIHVVRPRLTAAITILVPSAIFLLAAVATGAVPAVIAACAVLATSWMAGDLIFRLFQAPTTHIEMCAVTSIRIAMGLGTLGLAILILGSFNGISLLPVAALALVIVLTWSALNWSSPVRAFSVIPAFSREMPRLEWFETFLIALSAAFFVFASLATLTPETILTASDSVRQHLPQAREIWQDHAVLVFPVIESGSASVLGSSLNAVAFGLGGFTAVRILQLLVALCCLSAIAGLGATLAGRLAGIAGAAFFSCMPLVLWLSGHAYPDLLAVLFVCASVQCAICWQNDGQRIWLLIAGALGGFSLATKQFSAVVIGALLIALALSARPKATVVGRFWATVLFATACIFSASPWFVRSAILTGEFPLLGTLLGQLSNMSVLGNMSGASQSGASAAAPLGTVAEVFPGGVARTLPGIVTGPWDLTFYGAFSNWRSVRYGEFGILLLMFLPVVFFNLRSRGVLLIAITAFVSFVGWVFTIQVPRHLLPSLALVAVLAGISVASVIHNLMPYSRILLTRFVQAGVIVGLALTPLFFLPNTTTGFPVTVLTGATRPEDYLARVDPATPALTAATRLLPADSPVGYIGEWLGAQSSTEARLFYLGAYSSNASDSLDSLVGNSPGTIFNYFESWGIHYFIWDRPDTRPQDIDSTLLSGDFLLRHTTILGGDNGIYLFAIHPSGVPDPTTRTNLLKDPSFASLRESGNVWNGSIRDLSESGVLQPRRQLPVSQRVDVEPGQQYLFVLDGSCNSAKDKTRVSLTWLDARGSAIDTAADDLALGTKNNSTLMWRVAPEEAAAVDVGISTAAGAPCLVTNVGLYAYGTS